jgi:hypothetical protein
VKCGRNDAVNELGTVHVLVVICRLSDWLNKTESNRCPHAHSSPQSFAPFIKTIPTSVPISDWRSKSPQYRSLYHVEDVCMHMVTIMESRSLACVFRR